MSGGGFPTRLFDAGTSRKLGRETSSVSEPNWFVIVWFVIRVVLLADGNPVRCSGALGAVGSSTGLLPTCFELGAHRRFGDRMASGAVPKRSCTVTFWRPKANGLIS